MLINEVIKIFEKHGRYKEKPAYTHAELDFWEIHLGVPLPSSYRSTMKAGSFDTNNFNFITPPYRAPGKKEYVVFARWNDNLFAFDSIHTSDTGDYPVVVLSGDFEPEKIYPNFKEWFAMVIDACIAPNNVE